MNAIERGEQNLEEAHQPKIISDLLGKVYQHEDFVEIYTAKKILEQTAKAYAVEELEKIRLILGSLLDSPDVPLRNSVDGTRIFIGHRIESLKDELELRGKDEARNK